MNTTTTHAMHEVRDSHNQTRGLTELTEENLATRLLDMTLVVCERDYFW